MKRDAFLKIHPIIQIGLYLLIMAVTMTVMHPVMLIISFLSAVFYNFVLKKGECFKFLLKTVLPIMLIAVVINPLFNHEGATILTYLGGNPLTKESIIYGIYASIMFGSVLMWFSCFNETVSSDKIMYALGKIFPSLSLIISMTLRFVPHFKQRLEQIRLARAGMGTASKTITLNDKIKEATATVSAMTGLALEGAIETADSMKSRGYGSTKRTMYAAYKFKAKDIALTVFSLFVTGIIIYACIEKEIKSVFYPVFIMNSLNLCSLTVYFLFALLCMVPILLELSEEIRWRALKSKI